MLLKPTVWTFAIMLLTQAVYGQETPAQIPTAVETAVLLQAASPSQQFAIKNIYLVACPVGNGSAGTGFLVDSGIVVTNAHVLGVCDKITLIAIAPDNSRIHFKAVIKDEGRDLAILVPEIPLGRGLILASESRLPLGAQVSTWGYPYLYNGTSPLLSVGYVSGYRMDESHGRSTKRIILNAAINHGNSGGPLLLGEDNSVVGVVVATWQFYPFYLKQLLDALAKEPGAWSENFFLTRPDGSHMTMQLS